MSLVRPKAVKTVFAASLAAIAVASGALAGSSAMPQQSGAVDLRSYVNVWIDGAVARDHAGTSASGVGDVNGDGLADAAVGAPDSSNNGRRNSGSVWVVFGRDTAGGVDLARLDLFGGGFRIDGAEAFDHAGAPVAGAGDVNGDGRADVVVGAPFAEGSRGSAYVVFGRASGAPTDLGALGADGFRIHGTSAAAVGRSVAGAGDVNGDGRADVLIGADGASNNGRTLSGSAYVVFGKASSDPVELASLGEGGFRIDGSARFEFAGRAVAAGGDVNGDGRADVLVGSDADHNGRTSSGSTYVVFGRAAGGNVDLADLGDGGFRIDGARTGDAAGHAVASAGDVNGDGLSDVLVGASGGDANGRVSSGSAYLVFGKRSSAGVDLAALGGGGFQIDGANVEDRAGSAVAAPGDVNGDGRPDLLIGAPRASNNGRVNSGSAYVVYGKASTGAVDLGTLGPNGFRIDGAQVEYETGRSVSGAGDFNGDARPDVLVGSPFASTASKGSEGAVYVLYGFGAPELAYDPFVATAGLAIGVQRPRVLKRTGDATFSTSPALPSGLDIDPSTGAIFGTPLAGRRRTTYLVTMKDMAGSVSAPLILTVSDVTAPTVSVVAGATQPILRQNGVVLRASCSEACTLRVSGHVVVAGRGAAPLRAVRATLGAAGRKRLRLGLSRASRSRLAALLAGGTRGRATVTLRAVDRFGNARVVRRSISVTGS